jgi:hypothetical protein
MDDIPFFPLSVTTDAANIDTCIPASNQPHTNILMSHRVDRLEGLWDPLDFWPMQHPREPECVFVTPAQLEISRISSSLTPCASSAGSKSPGVTKRPRVKGGIDKEARKLRNKQSALESRQRKRGKLNQSIRPLYMLLTL